MYVTRYQWVYSYFYGWQMVPVQVFVPLVQTVSIQTYPTVYGYGVYGYGQGLRR